MNKSLHLRTGDISKDIWNDELGLNRWLTDKLKDEIVARLSELGGTRVGRINFLTVTSELKQLEKETVAYSDLMKRAKFFARRNAMISHKELPPDFKKHFDFPIAYPLLLRGLASALILMKKIDRIALGPSAPYLWRAARKKRYKPLYPARINYQLMPYLRLDEAARIQICFQELKEGLSTLERMPTMISGKPHTIPAIKKWGVIFIGNKAYALQHYPLRKLKDISIKTAE